MAQNQKSYDNEFKAQAVKLAQEIGGHKAAKELGIPKGTMYTWIKAFKEGRLSANEAVHAIQISHAKISVTLFNSLDIGNTTFPRTCHTSHLRVPAYPQALPRNTLPSECQSVPL